ncbi:MAG: GNAT family N-acetyltransferase [Acidobacteriota bacterium]
MPEHPWELIIEAHYRFQSGLFMPRIEVIEPGSLHWHPDPDVSDPDWNHARWPTRLGMPTEAWLDRVEARFAEIGRPPVIVAPAASENPHDGLKQRGYQLVFRHRWAFWSGEAEPRVAVPPTVVDTVETDADLEAFADVFSGAFWEDGEPPAGPAWRAALADAQRWRGPEVRIHHVLARYDGEPAGVATLCFGRGRFAGITGCYNLGVLPRFRRFGIGRALQTDRIRWAREDGTRTLFLQTESAVVEAWNRRHGWRSGPVVTGWGR